MKNDRRAQVKELSDRLSMAFQAAGALPVETDSLLPAEVLLDLYGEDIRARAFVTQDPSRGEQMLRPDFTVPIVQRHMAEGAEPARYTYAGTVWRKQLDPEQPTETAQVGYELFDRAAPASADAEVFALFSELLAPHDLTVTIGDMGILRAVVEGLVTSDVRRRALLRHLWRPARFRALLDRFAGLTPPPAHQVDLLVQVAVKGVEVVLDEAGPLTGLRSADEIKARIERLAEDKSAPPLSTEDHQVVLDILDMKGPAGDVLDRLSQLADRIERLRAPVEAMRTRHAALRDSGIDPDGLSFEVSFGRTTMEYYDGFVFGFADTQRRPVANGGRYDALTTALGQGRSIAAVGGVIRPEALLEAGA